MQKTIICYLFLFFYCWTLKAGTEDNFFQVEALPGDGIYSLLRRYELDQHSCNFQKFYNLNKLKKSQHLIVGRKYFIPIIIYSFNGKTIRSSIGINEWDLAVRIQKYNERMLERQLREASFKKDKVLWVPYHEINCPSQDLEIPSPVSTSPEAANSTVTGSRNFPIFGAKYAKTPLQSNKLKGKVYYVVSGHGGPDPGAMGQRGNYTLCEDEYSYDVALRLCRNLVAHGATAYMINRDKNDGIRDDKFLDCDYDEKLWGDVKMMRQQKARLFQRSNIINDLYEKNRLAGVAEQTTLIIHVDSRSKGERKDVFFYYQKGKETSRTLAYQLHRAMKRKYKQYRSNGQYHGTVSTRDLHMLRETKPTSIYVELANIRNNFDQQRIILQTNRQALADWLLEGLLE
jgi:N-acetylmuramoyl-L-alanine amidase